MYLCARVTKEVLNAPHGPAAHSSSSPPRPYLTHDCPGKLSRARLRRARTTRASTETDLGGRGVGGVTSSGMVCSGTQSAQGHSAFLSRANKP